MTEQEYINATNKAKLNIALTILIDIDADSLGDAEIAFRGARSKIREVDSYLMDVIEIGEG